MQEFNIDQLPIARGIKENPSFLGGTNQSHDYLEALNWIYNSPLPKRNVPIPGTGKHSPKIKGIRRGNTSQI